MRGFRNRTSVSVVVGLIDARVQRLGAERVPLAGAGGRVLAEAVVASDPFPPFARAAMDGYAVRGEETFGADTYAPLRFRVVGTSRPGVGHGGLVSEGEAVLIMTGAPVPEGADAVVKVESTREASGWVEVIEATPPGRNVGEVGEDLETGTAVFGEGRVLRPQDLGVLSALGRAEIAVTRRPRVRILVTGEELLSPGTRPRGYQIPDMNSPMLRALVERDGGVVDVVGPICDERAEVERALAEAAEAADLVLVSGGSSTGPEDHAPSLLAEMGELAVHGLALRPASPAGLGFVGGVPVMLLPGNPVSCLCAYDLFAGRIVRRGGGRGAEWSYRSVDRALGSKLVSALGRTDYARVRLVDDRVEPLATSGASILSGTSRADGFVMVPEDLEGYPAGAVVRVWLYD